MTAFKLWCVLYICKNFWKNVTISNKNLLDKIGNLWYLYQDDLNRTVICNFQYCPFITLWLTLQLIWKLMIQTWVKSWLVFKIKQDGVEHRKTLGHFRSINTHMTNHHQNLQEYQWITTKLAHPGLHNARSSLTRKRKKRAYKYRGIASPIFKTSLWWKC